MASTSGGKLHTTAATPTTGFAMQDVLFDLAIPSRVEAMGAVQGRLDAVLRRLGLDDDACHRIGLATHEAVVNAIVHGSRGDPGRLVEVQLACDGKDLVIRVADQGDGFDPAGVADPLRPENLLRPGGRGLLLMRTLMDEVGHRPGPTGGTVATLRRRLGGGPPHPDHRNQRKGKIMAKVTTRTQDGVTVVDVVGGIDSGLGDAVRQALDGGATNIALNLGGVDFLNSAGINVLASSHAAVSDRGGKLKLVSIQPKVQKVLAIARLDTVFEIHGTEDEAMASFA